MPQQRRHFPLLSLLFLPASAFSSATVTLELHPLVAGDSRSHDVVHWEGQQWRAVPITRRLTEHPQEEADPCEEAGHVAPGDPAYYFNLGMSVLMVLLAGVMAGCTMGLLSLDPLALRLKVLEGTPSERAYAEAILPVLESHHRLLVSLLLCNAAANEALPIFLDS